MTSKAEGMPAGTHRRAGRPKPRVLRSPALLMISPAVLFLLVVVLFPMIFLFYTSFQDLTFMNFRAGGSFVGLENYAELARDARLPIAMWNTFLFVFVGVGIQFILGLAMALVFSKVVRNNVVFALLLLPAMITPLIVGFLWKYILSSDFGIVSQLLTMAGFPPQAWLSDPSINIYVLLAVDIWQWTPFMFLILLAGLKTVPKEVTESAALDGASWWKNLLLVTLPLMKPIVFVAILFRAMDAFKIYDTVAVLTGGGPGSSSYTLTLKAMIDGFTHFRLSYAATVSVLSLVLATILVLLFLRFLYREMGREQ